jgi:Inositol hexakisphosphate
MGIPTREGVISVLDTIGACPGFQPQQRNGHGGSRRGSSTFGGGVGGGVGNGQRCAVCTNLREEPLLYINGTPYVLRETSGPYTNMKEYTGIDGTRLEALEARLKQEVLGEAAADGGRVHVLREEMRAQVGRFPCAWCIMHACLPDALQLAWCDLT